VERFHGELELASEEGRGSTFMVRLPIIEGED
jgi:signal transduction histidine kinase